MNLAKFVLVPVGNMDNVGNLAGILGCGMGSLPLKYFGLLLGTPFKVKAIWEDMLEKVARRLALWKRLYLSGGERGLLLSRAPYPISPLIFCLCLLSPHLWQNA